MCTPDCRPRLSAEFMAMLPVEYRRAVAARVAASPRAAVRVEAANGDLLPADVRFIHDDFALFLQV